MKVPIIVGAVLLGVVLIFIVLPKVIFHYMGQALDKRIKEPAAEILMKDLKANSFGRESKGMLQIRGNGGLVLTAKELHFYQLKPEADLRIPLNSITGMSITKSHLGKSKGVDMLKVEFTVDDKTDSIAWALQEPNAWKAKLEELRAK